MISLGQKSVKNGGRFRIHPSRVQDALLIPSSRRTWQEFQSFWTMAEGLIERDHLIQEVAYLLKSAEKVAGLCF